MRIVDALSGKQLLLYKGHGATGVLSVAWTASQYGPEYIVSGDNNGMIHVWNPNDGTTRFTVSQAAPVTGLAANYQFIAAGTQPGGTYNIWDSRTGQVMFQFHNDNQGDSDTPYMSINQQLTPGTLTAVGWSPDGQFVAVGDANGNVHFLSDISCSCFLHMSAFQAHKAQINASPGPRLGGSSQPPATTARPRPGVSILGINRRAGQMSEADTYKPVQTQTASTCRLSPGPQMANNCSMAIAVGT
ncbi:MAG TPA: WD40 repeat domain-containing protein [Ktedonobacteraceae bacterium]